MSSNSKFDVNFCIIFKRKPKIVRYFLTSPPGVAEDKLHNTFKKKNWRKVKIWSLFAGIFLF